MLLAISFTILVLALSHHIYVWKRKHSKLPPGSIGWPIIGELLSFMKLRPLGTIGNFIEHRVTKYGKTFSTNLFGTTLVITVDEDLNNFMIQNEKKIFDHFLPKHVKKLMGKDDDTLESMVDNNDLRNSVMHLLRREVLEMSVVREVDHIASNTVMSWKDGSVISMENEANTFVFNAVTNQVLGLVNGDVRLEELRKMYSCILKGLLGFPLNLPGTTYNKALHAKNKIWEILGKDIDEKIKNRGKQGRKNEEEGDMLDLLINSASYSKERMCELIHETLVAGIISSSTIICLAIYFLGECPRALKQLREEHEEIIRRGGRTLTWEDYKMMEFSQCVLNETLRFIGVGNFNKISKKDFEFKGYVIPSGTPILNFYPRLLHFDPSTYENPESFNPWRWMDKSLYVQRSKNLNAFGRGPRRCPGDNFARLQIVIFLRNFVLNYDMKLEKRDHPLISCKAFVEHPKGLSVVISKR